MPAAPEGHRGPRVRQRAALPPARCLDALRFAASVA